MEFCELISVVIPTYNRREALPAAIESVCAQTYENIELIVVDDASTDGTHELFAAISDPRVKYLRYEQNRGACYARNLGAAQARGALIAFQDSDDTWHADKLEKQYRRLCDTGAEMCFCGMRRVAENGSAFYYPVHAPGAGNPVGDFLSENRASTQTMLMRREVWERLRFDEDIRRYQDWDFAIRAAAQFDLVYLPEALVDSAVGRDSISARVASYPHLLRLYEKHSALYMAHPESRAIMNRRMGKRLHPQEPRRAAAHFKTSLDLTRSPYDWGYWALDTLLSHRQAKKG